jgi:ubiquinone/menaquinone biosynthesis C-methylase UbiE
MPDHKTVYQKETDLYHLLVMREDYQHNLPNLLEKLLAGQRWNSLELGAGTGRLTKMLRPLSDHLTALDVSPAMLIQAKEYLVSQTGYPFPQLAAADHRALPVADHSVSLIAAGWSVCYLVSWYPETWQIELKKAMDEMQRVITQGGMVMLIETQGTGKQQPDPPTHLIPYYEALKQFGFEGTWIRTDYLFQSRDEAEMLTRFFFGDEMINEITSGDISYLPECTGIWWKHI